MAAASRAAAQATGQWYFDNVAPANLVSGCVTGITLAGFEIDPAGRPVLAWREENACGPPPRVFWSRPDTPGSPWNTREFFSERTTLGGAPMDYAHQLAVRRTDGTPFLVYADVGSQNEINTYRANLGTNPNGGASSGLENLVAAQNCAYVNYSPAFGPTDVNPQWATGLALCNSLGPVRINGVAVNPSVFNARPSFVVDVSGTRHLLWNSGTNTYYSRWPAGGTLQAPVTILTTGSRFGGEVRIDIDAEGVLHAVLRGPDVSQDSDIGAIVYLRSTDGGTTWSAMEYVDNHDAPGGDVFNQNSDVSLAIDPNGIPAVAYWRSQRELWFARRDGPGQTWTRSRVTTLASNNAHRINQLRFDANGQPVIAFYDPATTQLRLARPVPSGVNIAVDVAVTAGSVPVAAPPGSPATFTFTVNNQSAIDVSGIVVRPQLPAGFLVQTISPPLDANGQWGVDLRAGVAAGFTVTGTVPFETGPLAATVTATTAQDDVAPANNTAAAVINVFADACFVPQANRTGWWRGDDSTGNAVSGQPNGTLVGGVSYVPAVIGDGFQFDGTTGAVRAEHGNDNVYYPGAGSFTVQAWVNTTDSDGVIAARYECQPGSCTPTAWFLTIVGGQLQGFVRDTANASIRLTGTTPISDGSPHHVAMVIDRATAQLRLYVDGLLDASAPFTLGPITDGNGLITPLTIGAWLSFDGLAAFLGGVIDEFAIHNRALTAAEIATVAAAISNGACSPNVNHPPVAVDDAVFLVGASGSVDIAPLGNDSDPDGDTLEIDAIVTQPSFGRVTQIGRSARYDANWGQFAGSDSFTYRVTDGRGGTGVATITITTPPAQTADLRVEVSPMALGAEDGLPQVIVTVTNAGPGTPEQIFLTGYAHGNGIMGNGAVSGGAAVGSCFPPTDQVLPCQLQPLAPGQQASVTMRLWPATLDVRSFEFTALALSDMVDTNLSNNTASLTIDAPLREIDLGVALAAPVAYQPGDVVPFTITVSNTGPAPSVSTTIELVLDGVGEPSAACFGRQPDVDRTSWRCNVPRIDPGASWTLTLMQRSVTQGSRISTAAIAPTGFEQFFVTDLNPANDTASLSTSAVLVDPIACFVPPVGLRGWWRAEGNTADGFNAWQMTGSVSYAPSRNGQAFRFLDGSFVMAALHPLPRASAMTIGAWTSRSTSAGTIAPVIADGVTDDTLGARTRFWLGFDGGYPVLQFIDAGAVVAEARGPGAVPADTWTHLAAILDGDTARLFVNGEQVGTVTVPLSRDGDLELWFGASFTGLEASGLASTFVGLIDDVVIYDRALGASEMMRVAGDAAACLTNQPPTLEQPGARTNRVGEAVSLQLVGDDPDHTGPLVYTATNLPSGVSIDAAAGVISGVIAVDGSGDRTVTVTVSDGLASVSRDFEWSVLHRLSLTVARGGVVRIENVTCDALAAPASCVVDLADGGEVEPFADPAPGLGIVSVWSVLDGQGSSGTDLIAMDRSRVLEISWISQLSVSFAGAVDAPRDSITASIPIVSVLPTDAREFLYCAPGAALCVGRVPTGTIVTLSGVSTAAQVFDGFEGACTGTGCAIAVDRDNLAVVARYKVRSIRLTIEVGLGGAVLATNTDDGSEIVCAGPQSGSPAVCDLSFAYGSHITIEPYSQSGGEQHWVYAQQQFPPDSTGTLTLTASTRVGVSFTTLVRLTIAGWATTTPPITATPAIAFSCAVQQSVGAVCDAVVPRGASYSLAASSVPSESKYFTGWSVACGGTAACALNADVPELAIVASFADQPPTIVIDIVEQILVADTVGVSPAVQVPVDEAIVVTDDVMPRPALQVVVDEQITVDDQVLPRPALQVVVNEAIAVDDEVAPRPALQVAVVENITVTDDTSVQPQAATPPANTPVGSNVFVQAGSAVTLTLSTVTQAGTTTYQTIDGLTPPSSFRFGNPAIVLDISTTAVFTPPVGVCITFPLAAFVNPAAVRLFHMEGGVWVDRTVSVNSRTGVVCGSVNSLSPFALAEPIGVAGIASGEVRVGEPRERERVSFRVVQPERGRPRGTLTITEQAPRHERNTFKSTEVDVVTLWSDRDDERRGRNDSRVDTAVWSGSGEFNGVAGYTFVALATDRATHGRGRDQIDITVFDPQGNVAWSVGGVIGAGQIRITDERER